MLILQRRRIEGGAGGGGGRPPWCRSMKKIMIVVIMVAVLRGFVAPKQLAVAFSPSSSSSSSSSSSITSSISQAIMKNRMSLKETLLREIASTPSNAPTSRTVTQSILTTIRELEKTCPMDENDEEEEEEAKNDLFLNQLAGNWELLWTTQDDQSDEWNMAGPFRRWINPLENQSYSNNPLGSVDERELTGRANPILPRPIQDRLEAMGLIDTKTTSMNNISSLSSDPSVRSSQSIDLAKRLVRNVVTFRLPSYNNNKSNSNNNKPTTVTLTVFIQFWPDTVDRRKINVKFESCRVRILPKPAMMMVLPIMTDFTIPLGVIGPTGWLRTTYLDDHLRITRGFKGSVFVLTRPTSR
ncbi:plastid lipid-associated PAP/fibrillin family protein [Nitzschia inconspicua]|uniref:Plastid lipid-associated PAP/fibrillin family protein n=1 Tax=Nitzschia inconspicua TaxID=303405 RepID=A0A9K3L4F5_9STRA|nr:plastid lipid-associated PAP/fibrillin family protein [Nitzschia inconspicua]